MGALVFLDTETTGTKADEGDRIVDVAAVRVSNRRIEADCFQAYVNPERGMGADAERIHGLTDQFLRDKPTFPGIADRLISFIEDSSLYMHNAKFDQEFLDMEFARIGKPKLEEIVDEIVDTLAIARRQFPTGGNSLNRLCERLQIDISGREVHGALKDAKLLAQVHLAMTRGQIDIDLGAGDAAVRSEAALPDGSARQAGAFKINVVEATPSELKAHESWMDEMGRNGAQTPGKA